MKILSIILSYTALFISVVAAYISIITIITFIKMNHYQNMRMDLWPKPIAFEYSAKWFETAQWRDKMLFFLPSLGFVNKDKYFDAYPHKPESKKINDNWENTSINATNPLGNKVIPYTSYLQEPTTICKYPATISISQFPPIYTGIPYKPGEILPSTTPTLSPINTDKNIIPN